MTTLFDERQDWKKDVAASLALHALLAAAIIGISWSRLGHSGDNWGGDQAGEGAINATLVSSAPAIPLPSNPEPTENVVANDTKSVAPPEPAPEVKTPPPPVDTKAVEIPDKTTKVKPEPEIKQPEAPPKPVTTAKKVEPPRPTPTYKAPTAPPNTASYADAGHVNMAMGVSTSHGAGALAVVGGGDFGSRYAWYVQAVQRKVQQAWLAYETDPHTAQGRRVYLTFDIHRDGTLTNVRVAQPSGVPSLDYSAMNAMRRIDTFGPLPADYRGNYVSVQFYFDYKR